MNNVVPEQEQEKPEKNFFAFIICSTPPHIKKGMK